MGFQIAWLLADGAIYGGDTVSVLPQKDEENEEQRNWTSVFGSFIDWGWGGEECLSNGSSLGKKMLFPSYGIISVF